MASRLPRCCGSRGDQGRAGPAVRHARIQPLDTGCSQERHRPCLRPYGQSAWAGKPAGVIGASVGAIGTAMAQQHPRNVLAYLDVPTLGQPEGFIHAKEGLFDADGGIGEASREFLQGWVNQYVAWVKKHA